MTREITASLIGIHEQVNGETGDRFWNLSLKCGPNAIASLGVNDVEKADKLIEAFKAAGDKGHLIVFSLKNAELTVAEESHPDTNEMVPVIRKSTRYYRVGSADQSKQLEIQATGTRPRGAVITLPDAL